MKQILLGLLMCLWAGSAFAVCSQIPLLIRDANNNIVAMSSATSTVDGNCKTYGATELGLGSGGLSVKTLAALTNTAVAVKASAGQVYKVECFNPDVSAKAYIQTFDVAAAGVTMGTTAPKDFVGVGPGQTAGFTFSMVGEQHATAISAGAATTATGGTAPSTALDCTVAYN